MLCVNLKMEAKETKDEKRKFMLNFIIISRNFRLFFEAIRSGHCISQEYFTLEWLPMFYLLKNAIMLISALQQLRVNTGEFRAMIFV